MEVLDLSITSAIDGLRNRRFSSLELVTECLRNIKRFDQNFNAILTTADPESLFHQARQTDSTDYSLPLSGVPLVLKDLFSTRSLRTTAGSKVLENYVPVYDATVVKKLKDAGAIIIAKANQDAWGHGSTGENSDFGPTRNALNQKYVAGGSSSGSAVAVALGMCLAATGTDTGGSIRVPASYNNLVGLKPTYGRVSRYGIIAMASSLDSIGHITKTVEDSAYLLNVTAGRDPYDATTSDRQVPDYTQDLDKRKSLRGLTIGVFKDGIEKILHEAVSSLEQLGAKVLPVSLPGQEALETYYILVPSEISSDLARFDGLRFGQGREKFGPEARRRIMIGTHSLSSGYYGAYYQTAQKIRTLIVREFDQTFAKVDLILTPVTANPPVTIGKLVDDPLALYLSDIYTVPANLAGLPSLSLPAGFVTGLPVGLQLIGPQWSEKLLFESGFVYEKETQWRQHGR